MNAIDSLGDRARDFALASALSSYPDEDVEATLRAIGPSIPAQHAARAFVRALATPGGLDELRSSYVDLFDRGDARIPLYETEYGRMRGMSKGRDLADISGFYKAFGLEIDASEMLDHIAVELEFYAVLLAKQDYLERAGDAEGREVVEDARRKFLTDHLGPLAGGVAARFSARLSSVDRQATVGEPDGAPAQPAHAEALSWCGDLVSRECASLAVTPTPLDMFAVADDAAEMKCGAVHLPMMPT